MKQKKTKPSIQTMRQITQGLLEMRKSSNRIDDDITIKNLIIDGLLNEYSSYKQLKKVADAITWAQNLIYSNKKPWTVSRINKVLKRLEKDMKAQKATQNMVYAVKKNLEKAEANRKQRKNKKDE